MIHLKIMKKNQIYTVGHSTHEIDYFIELIKHFDINCIVDVRSIAASSYNPQFNKDFLSNSLKKNSILYMHFSEEFGARHTDPDLLDDDEIGQAAETRLDALLGAPYRLEPNDTPEAELLTQANGRPNMENLFCINRFF